MVNEDNLKPSLNFYYIRHLIKTCYEDSLYRSLFFLYTLIFGSISRFLWDKIKDYLGKLLGINWNYIVIMACIGLIFAILVLFSAAYIIGTFAENKKLIEKNQTLNAINEKNETKIDILTRHEEEYEKRIKNAAQTLEFDDISCQQNPKIGQGIRLKCKYPPRINTLVAIEYKNHRDDFFLPLSTGRVISVNNNNVLIEPAALFTKGFRFSKGKEFRVYVSVTIEEIQADYNKMRQLTSEEDHNNG